MWMFSLPSFDERKKILSSSVLECSTAITATEPATSLLSHMYHSLQNHVIVNNDICNH